MCQQARSILAWTSPIQRIGGQFFKKTFQITGRFFIFLFLGISSVYAQTAVDYVQRGNAYQAQENYDQAIADYTKAIDISPEFAKAYDNRGVAYAKIGQLSSAISDFTMAIANNPNDAQAYNNRGHAYAKLDNFFQAISDYTRAIKINPNYAKAYNNRGIAFYTTKKYDKAWADAHKVEELGGTVDPNFIAELRKAAPSGIPSEGGASGNDK